MEKLFYILLCVGSLVGCIALGTYWIYRESRTVTVKISQPSLTSLQELNKEFHRQYSKARDNVWHSETEHGSIIIVNGSSLTLIHRGSRHSVHTAIPQVYDDLKSIAHIPLTTYLLLLNNNSSTLTDDTLEQYWQHLNNLEIPDSIDLNEQPSVKRIIDASQRLLQKQINNKGSIDRNQLIQFCRDLVGDLVPLFNAAAIAQLNKMHEIVQGWINEHNIDRQDSSFKVILIGARTARQNNIQATYFERLLGVERQKHIAYIEEIFNNELRVFSIFSTWFLDEQIGVTFFNDQDRMHRDLLMNDHVHQYIEQLIP